MAKVAWWAQEQVGDGGAAGGGGAAAGAAGDSAAAAGGAAGAAGGAAAGAAGAAAGDGKTIMTGGGAAADGKAVAPPAWPENWRQLHTTDDKKLKQLERYASPSAALDALFEAQKKISSGELKAAPAPFPADGTDEQKTAWRKDNGLPAKPEEYDLTFEDGTKISDEDKGMVGEFAKAAFDLNMSPAHTKGAIGAYLKIRDKEIDALMAKDTATRTENDNKLRQEWGGDYQRNINMIKGLLAQAPNGLAERMAIRRTGEGVPFGNDIDAMRWLADIARKVNPAIAVVPNAGQNVSGAIDDEIKAIETLMNSPKGSPEHKKYWDDDATQKRYRELLGARAGLQAQAK